MPCFQIHSLSPLFIPVVDDASLRSDPAVITGRADNAAINLIIGCTKMVLTLKYQIHFNAIKCTSQPEISLRLSSTTRRVAQKSIKLASFTRRSRAPNYVVDTQPSLDSSVAVSGLSAARSQEEKKSDDRHFSFRHFLKSGGIL